MSLRKPPVRTPALVAANRANAAKSTGLRTLRGKQRSSWNALLHGRRSRAAWDRLPHDERDAEAFDTFLEALRLAMLPAESEAGERFLIHKAREIWRFKILFDRWLATRTKFDLMMLASLGPLAAAKPTFRRFTFKRPGLSEPDWKVTVSVALRWGREPDCILMRDPEPGSDREAWRSSTPRLHTVVSVTCAGHPWLDSRERIPTKPECLRNE